MGYQGVTPGIIWGATEESSRSIGDFLSTCAPLEADDEKPRGVGGDRTR